MKDYLLFLPKLLQKSKIILSHKYVFFGVVGVSLLILLFLSLLVIEKQTQLLAIKSDPFPLTKAADYPLLERTFAPVITAGAAYIMDNTSKVVLFAKNDTVRFSPASTTKIMTALVALDYYKMTDALTIQRSGVEPVVVGFPKGARVKFEDMLYAMLLPSGNDAALAIADNYPGGESAFVAQMNKKAKLLSLTSSHFADPVGLFDDEDFSTVRDMAILASYASSNPILSKVVATKETDIADSTGHVYHLKSTNKLLGLYGVNGVKTGYTDLAGEVLATSAVIRGHTFIIIVMKSQDRFADTEKLLQLLTDNVTFVPIRP